MVYVEDDGLILVDGSIFDVQALALGTNTYVSDIKIYNNNITIYYELEGESGTVDTTIEWRVR